MENKKNLTTLLNKNISLTSDHYYILKENNSKQIFTQSVTDIIEGHFKEFDADLISKSLAKYASKYKGMDPYDIRQEWEKKKVHGSKVHTQIEKYILSNKKPSFKQSKVGAEWFNNNCKKYGEEYYPEVKVFSEEHKIGGTVDLLIYNKEKDGCYIFDWKTSGSDIHKSKGKGITSVTSDLKDCKYTTYELQLSMYKYLLQEIHDIKIINHFVVHLKDSTADLLKTKYYKSHCIKMLKDLPDEDDYDEDYYDNGYDEEDYNKEKDYNYLDFSPIKPSTRKVYHPTPMHKFVVWWESSEILAPILFWGVFYLVFYMWIKNC